MKTTVSDVDPDPEAEAPASKVRLTVEVDEETFESAIDEAFRKISREVRIPGFRPGKAPRRVLESRLGTEFARAQALEDAIPTYYADAVRDNQVDVIAAPDLELTSGQDSGPVVFEAVVEIRPEITVAGYRDLTVEIPNPRATDEAVNEQIDAIRAQNAELVDVEREAADGDNVSIDINGSVDGEPLPGLTAEDYLYEVGSNGIVEAVDEELCGASAGDELEFSAPHPVQEDVEIDFTITVHSVKERELPELTDDWVDENTEHDTVEELTEQTRSRIQLMAAFQAKAVLHDATGNALAELVEDPVPEAMVNGEMSDSLQQLGSRLAAQGMGLEQWMAMTGQDPEQFTVDLKEAAERSAKVDLALRALAVVEEIEVGDDDIDEELGRVSEQVGESVDDLRETLERGDGLQSIRSELLKRKALDWLVDQVELVDPDGASIDRADLEIPEDPSTDSDEDTADADDVSEEDD